MKVPLLDLKKQYESIKDEVISATMEVFDSQRFILGSKVDEFEEKIAAYCRCRYAVGVSSGSDALLISLMAAGVGVGDLVITTPYTFFATVGAIARVGASPKFIDIDNETYNLDPEKLEATISSMKGKEKKRIKAIIPVHLFGQCADMESIINVSKEYGLTVIEDAAQAIGSEYEFSEGLTKRAGSMGEYGCFSFFPSKNLGAFGDAGIVSTDEKDIYNRLKIIRVHGSKPKYFHNLIGGNFRIDAIQAAILTVKLKYLDEWTKKRRENAILYRRLFQEEGLEEIYLPEETEKKHIYNQFVIKVREKRNMLKEYLNSNGIGCEVYYPVPLHIQPCFKYLGYKSEDFPISVRAAGESLALPIYPELTSEQIHYVVDMVRKFIKSK